MEVVFWVSFFIIFYSYFGYGILVYFLVRLTRIFRPARRVFDHSFTPSVALIVSAYNEEEVMEEKIRNTLELEYPRELLEILFITDGSTDGSNDIIRRYPQIVLLHEPERKGKIAAMNRAVAHVQSPILIFCDANTLLNPSCVRQVVKHYSDPHVGGVAGEKRILQSDKNSAASTGEGLYWKYESFLKKLDSDLHTTVGAAGELFSIRKELFEITPHGVIIEDFVQSMRLCVRGFSVRYEPEAYAMETGSASIREEMKRKVRICAGAFQAMVLLKDLFNVFRYPVVSFQFISHRILRWTICPIALIVMLLANVWLVVYRPSPLYIGLLVAQLLFNVLAVTGWVYANKNIRVKALYVPFYFLFMNMAVFMGFNRFIQKKQTVLWEKAERQKVAPSA